jgi:predicted RNase H-like nuclease (RuvC/YqgF family)
MMAKAPIAFLAVLVFSLAASWLLTWQVVVPEKDQQLLTKQDNIDGKQTQIDFLNTKLDAANRDNEKLRSDNANLQEARDEKNFPLKKRAQILAQQIADFADSIENDKSGQKYQFLSNEWNNRLSQRIDAAVRALDEMGQHSDKIEQFNQMNFGMINDPRFISGIREEAVEIKKLADAIPETP